MMKWLRTIFSAVMMVAFLVITACCLAVYFQVIGAGRP
jgi:hypothetical protein